MAIQAHFLREREPKELTFLQLLFGYHSFEELTYAFADCWTRKLEIKGLISTLFPKKSSNVWPLGLHHFDFDA